MTLCDEVTNLLTPRQANVGSKNQKKECPECGNKLARYQGRYPNKCPGCKAEFSDLI